MLIKALRGQLEPRAAKIENTKQLKQDCLNKDHCILLLKGGKPEKYVANGFKTLMAEFPQVSFASIDANILLLTNMENTNLPQPFVKDQHRLMYFKKVSGGIDVVDSKKKKKKDDNNKTTEDDDGEDDSDDEKKEDKKKDDKKKSTGRLVSSGASYTGKSFHHPPLSNFIQDALKGKYKPTKLPALPAIKTRTKKNEEAEVKKRDRYVAQQARKRQQEEEAADPKPQGAFSSDGSGSAEDRKAQRDRIREEHRLKNNVKELTPEEKAEKESQRRERMAEEAAKWNIQSEEDFIPEGEPVDGDEEPIDWDDADGEASDEEDLDEDVEDLD
jgi:hypothetical protein